MRIQPIRTETDYDAAVVRIAQLIGAKAGTSASDELEILVTLVDAYEAQHYPMDMPDPITVVKFQMEHGGFTRKDLEPMIGSRARVSEVLTGKRALTLPMIRRLHSGLGIPIELLVGDDPTAHHARAHGKKMPPIRASSSHRAVAARLHAR
jgi:HTH-type transcriptional regulator/antitoxin HigA